jgi:hypothetical protein
MRSSGFLAVMRAKRTLSELLPGATVGPAFLAEKIPSFVSSLSFAFRWPSSGPWQR